MLSAACSWILGLKERVHAVFCMPLDPRSEGESEWGLLHALDPRSEGESAWGLLHAARSYKRSEEESDAVCCMQLDPRSEGES
jgi:hypothetical protein